MESEELAEIEARANAATPGPWETHVTYCVITLRYGDDGYLVADCGASESPDCCEGNAPFIAHARTDVPALVAEVRRLTAEVERLEAMVPRWVNVGTDRAVWRLRVAGQDVVIVQLESKPNGRWYEWPTSVVHPNLPTACAAVCRRLGLPEIKPPETP